MLTPNRSSPRTSRVLQWANTCSESRLGHHSRRCLDPGVSLASYVYVAPYWHVDRTLRFHIDAIDVDATPDYAAIGNIIDDDGSGYISALEFNVFLKSETRCLPGWTKPQWFALYVPLQPRRLCLELMTGLPSWASGWRNNNAW